MMGGGVFASWCRGQGEYCTCRQYCSTRDFWGVLFLRGGEVLMK